MTEKYTTQLQCMSDLRTGYFHGCVIWQCSDRLNCAVFELLLTIPCILDWLLCYICDFPINVFTPYIYTQDSCISFIGIALFKTCLRCLYFQEVLKSSGRLLVHCTVQA